MSREKEYDADEEKNELEMITADYKGKEMMLRADQTLARLNQKPGSKTESGMSTLTSDLKITPSNLDMKVKPIVVMPVKMMELPDVEGKKLDKSIEDLIDADYKPASCEWAKIARKIITLPSVMKCAVPDSPSPFKLTTASSPFGSSVPAEKPQTIKVQACVGYVVCERKTSSTKTMRMSTCSVESCGKGDAVKCTMESGYHSEHVSDDSTSTAAKEIRDAMTGSKAKPQ